MSLKYWLALRFTLLSWSAPKDLTSTTPEVTQGIDFAKGLILMNLVRKPVVNGV